MRAINDVEKSHSSGSAHLWNVRKLGKLEKLLGQGGLRMMPLSGLQICSRPYVRPYVTLTFNADPQSWPICHTDYFVPLPHEPLVPICITIIRLVFKISCLHARCCQHGRRWTTATIPQVMTLILLVVYCGYAGIRPPSATHDNQSPSPWFYSMRSTKRALALYTITVDRESCVWQQGSTLQPPKSTEQNRIVRTGKFEAKVTNDKKLCSRYCTVEATKLTTDRHEASHGLFATAKLLVIKSQNMKYKMYLYLKFVLNIFVPVLAAKLRTCH